MIWRGGGRRRERERERERERYREGEGWVDGEKEIERVEEVRKS